MTNKCLLPICSSAGPLQTFRLQAIRKLLECATERNDGETYSTIQGFLDAQGEEASLELHKGCYCSFTSKHYIKKLAAKKRKCDSVSSVDEPPARIRRSEVSKFDFKTHCLFCGKDCEPVNSKHPDRWEQVVQCEKRHFRCFTI